MRWGQHFDLDPKDTVLDNINPPGICISHPMSQLEGNLSVHFEGVGLLADVKLEVDGRTLACSFVAAKTMATLLQHVHVVKQSNHLQIY